MKKIVWSIVGFIMLSAQALMAAVTVRVMPSFGPNTAVSQSYGDYRTNALSFALGYGGGTSGTPGYYSTSTVGNINQMIVTKTATNFNYWAGVINPSGNYSNEYGGNLFIGAIIDGGGSKVSLSKVDYNIQISDYFSDAVGNYLSSSTYSITRIGLMSNGFGGYTQITSGSSTNECDAIFLLRTGTYGFATDGSGTAQQQLDEILNTHSNFSFNATFTYDAGGLNVSDTKIINVIPEPAIAGMVAIGGVLIWIKRRFYAQV